MPLALLCLASFAAGIGVILVRAARAPTMMRCDGWNKPRPEPEPEGDQFPAPVMWLVREADHPRSNDTKG